MDYKKTAPNIPAESGSGTIRTSRIYKGSYYYHNAKTILNRSSNGLRVDRWHCFHMIRKEGLL